MLTLKTIWITLITASLAGMFIYHIVMAARHNSMSDVTRRPVHRRIS